MPDGGRAGAAALAQYHPFAAKAVPAEPFPVEQVQVLIEQILGEKRMQHRDRYLVDHDLSDSKRTGLDVIQELGIQPRKAQSGSGVKRSALN